PGPRARAGRPRWCRVPGCAVLRSVRSPWRLLWHRARVAAAQRERRRPDLGPSAAVRGVPPARHRPHKGESMTLRPHRSALAVALALAATPAFAGEYSGTVFFGDSLTDSGHFQSQIPAEARPVTGKFTTNPSWVWAEHLAKYFGDSGRTANQGGDNYAQGGSRVTVQNGPAESTLAQVGTYLAAHGGRADPDALYTVWTGANDLFAVAAGTEPAAETIATAVGGVVRIVGTLQGAGARYVLVPSLPDMGLTPDARAAGPVGQAALSQLSANYNSAMYGALAQAG